MSHGPPETKTTPDTQTNVIYAVPPATPGVRLTGLVEMIQLDPAQACRILIPPEAFIIKFDRIKFAGNVNLGTIDRSEWDAEIQYLADHPPDYGLVTNFPPESWDSVCFLWSGVRESLLDLGQEHLGDYKKESNYRIEEVGPEGKGVVAARDFRVGDLILLERPAVLLPNLIPGFGTAELQGLLDKMLARLPEDVRNGYMTLSNCYPEYGALRGALRTNCIGVKFPGNDVMYHAVAIDLSRCNHRCALSSLDHICWLNLLFRKLCTKCRIQIQSCQVCFRAPSPVPH